VKTLDIRRLIQRCTECGQQYSVDAKFCPFDGSRLEQGRWDSAGDPLIGTIVDGRYEVIEPIGEGGMGTVYRVRHTTLARPFAMKVLKKTLASDETLAARFLQEAKATAAVKHPQVVAINDFGRLADDRPYFVMEHLGGRTLSQALRIEGSLTPAFAARITERVARAVGAAHEAKIVHRDVKPENVFLLDEVGDDVRVVDFGASMIVGASRITKTGVVFGTPHYMSPEQATGRVVDQRADIYALGVAMYEMLTGRLPFEADTFMGVITQHMFVLPSPPSAAMREGVELGALDAICMRALEKNPDKRYLTMSAFADDLRTAFQDGAAPPVTHSAPVSEGARARPLVFALAGLALAVAALGVVLAVRTRGAGTDAETPTSPRAAPSASAASAEPALDASIVVPAPLEPAIVTSSSIVLPPPSSGGPKAPRPAAPPTTKPVKRDDFKDPWSK
jgi:serine/threonine-protein kinase